MKARETLAALAALVLFGLSGCFDPIVGAECKAGLSPCNGVCVASGTCVDASSLDGGGIDGAGSEASRGLDTTAETEGLDGGPMAAVDGQAIDQAAIDGQAIDRAIDSGQSSDRAAIDSPTIDQLAADSSQTDQADSPLVDAAEIGDQAEDSGTEDGADDTADGTEVEDAPYVPDLPPEDSPVFPEDAPPMMAADADALLDGEGQDTEGQDSDDACAACLDSDGADGETGPIDGTTADDGDATTDTDDADQTGADVDTAPDGPLICDDQQIICSNRCVSPASDPDNCGQCDNPCDTRVCIQGACLVCASDEGVCNQRCVTLATDRDNCGRCDNPCTNGLCSNGQCEAAGTGRIIVIGHDYLNNRSDMNRILGNAVFLWPMSPVRLLAYKVWANSAAVPGVEGAISQVAAATGRQYTLTRAQDESSAGIAAALESADVFLIYGQEFANNDILVRLGTTWKAALSTFVQNGGTLIVLDGVYQANAGTVQIVSQASDDGEPKLFDLARDISTTGDVCTVTAPGDALAVGLPKMYFCESNSTSFLVSDEATTITQVVADDEHVVVLDKTF